MIYTFSGGLGKGGNVDFPEGHAYICLDCGEVTVLTDEELFALKARARQSAELDAGRVACGACGSESTSPALRCPRCGKYLPRPEGGRPICPHCKEPFPSLFGEN